MGEIKILDSAITVSGSLTVDTVPKLYQKPLHLQGGHYQVDLKSVEEIDSAGMALLLYWWTRSGEQGSRLEFLHCPEKLLRIAGVSGLDSVFGTPASLE